MKRIVTLLFIFLSLHSYSQDLPSTYETGFAFPIGTKFTIKIDSSNPESIKYSILKFEAFSDIIDYDKTDDLFAKDGEEGTIDFYFCVGTYGKDEKEKDKNMKVLLLMRNRTTLALNYFSEIQMKEEEEFKETSNVGTFPGARGTEMWPYMINAIGIRDFKIMK